VFLFQRLSDTLRAHPAALVGECGLDRARRGLATIEQQVIKRICDVSQKGVFPIGPLSALIWYSWEYAPLSDNKIGVPFSQLEPLSALTLSSWECLCVSCVGRAPCVGRSLLVSGALCVGALCVGWSPVGPSPPVSDSRHVDIRSRDGSRSCARSHGWYPLPRWENALLSDNTMYRYIRPQASRYIPGSSP